jgi:hypothetical protein
MATIGRRNTMTTQPRRGAVVPLLPHEGEDLHTLYNRYRSVSGRLAPDLITTPEMVAARSALIHALIADGWEAPEIVLDRLRKDEQVLHPLLVVA